MFDAALIIALLGALGIGALINQIARWVLVDRRQTEIFASRTKVENTESLAGTAIGLARALAERNGHLETEVGKLRGEVAYLRAQLESYESERS